MVNETVPKDILDKLNAGITISGIDLDIRDLTSVSDSVEAVQTTTKTFNTYSFNEWLVDNGTFRGNSISAVNGTATVTTVPANKIIYVTLLNLSIHSVAATTTTCSLVVNGLTVIRGESSSIVGTTVFSTVAPTIPMKITAGQTIQVISGATNISATGSYSGYMVDA